MTESYLANRDIHSLWSDRVAKNKQYRKVFTLAKNISYMIKSTATCYHLIKLTVQATVDRRSCEKTHTTTQQKLFRVSPLLADKTQRKSDSAHKSE